eukprot:sb/3472693/
MVRFGIIVCDGNPKWISMLEDIATELPIKSPLFSRFFYRPGDHPLEYFHAWKGDVPTLASTSHLDGLISLGSAHMVDQVDSTPWMRQLGNFFLAVENSPIKVHLLPDYKTFVYKPNRKQHYLHAVPSGSVARYKELLVIIIQEVILVSPSGDQHTHAFCTTV